MEFEGRESFGVGKLEDFNWRRFLDMYTCTECGRCNDQCPAHVTGKPLQPREIITHERDSAYAMADHLIEVGKLKAQGRDDVAEAKIAAFERPTLIGEVNDEEAIWACNDLRLVRLVVPGDDRPHPQHHRPAPLHDDDGGRRCPRPCRMR